MLKASIHPFYIAFFLFLFPLFGQTANQESISIDLHYSIEWWLQDDSTPFETGETLNAFRAQRAEDPEGKKVYFTLAGADPWPCDISNVKRTFNLPKTTFLLGEPILIEYRVELNGPGEWTEDTGGCYRARGRDDNFLFLMQDEDGTFVQDPYGKIEYYMGGLGGPKTITQEKPLQIQHALQEWCKIQSPGKYHLYCFKKAQGYDVFGSTQYFNDHLPEKWDDYKVNDQRRLVHEKTGEKTNLYIAPSLHCNEWPETPLKPSIPDTVYQKAKNHVWNVGQCEAFAHFIIQIDKGTPKEQKTMVERYTNKYEEISDDYGNQRLLQKAIWFSGNKFFLPFIQKQIENTSSQEYLPFTGLAMWKHPKALKMILSSDNHNALASLRHLPSQQIRSAIPVMIKLLTDEDHVIRALSEQNLRQWTGEEFNHTWQGYHYQRPTLEEAKAMKPLWDQWWKENKTSFQPKSH